MRLAAAIASLGILGLVPMATAAMLVALIGVAMAGIALHQLREITGNVRDANRHNREAVSDMVRDGENRHDDA